MRIDVYGYEGCPFCEKVQVLLTSKGYVFQYHDIHQSQSAQLDFDRRCSGAKTVPQVLVGETLVGGYDDTLKAIVRGQFQQLVGGF